MSHIDAIGTEIKNEHLVVHAGSSGYCGVSKVMIVTKINHKQIGCNDGSSFKPESLVVVDAILKERGTYDETFRDLSSKYEQRKPAKDKNPMFRIVPVMYTKGGWRDRIDEVHFIEAEGYTKTEIMESVKSQILKPEGRILGSRTYKKIRLDIYCYGVSKILMFPLSKFPFDNHYMGKVIPVEQLTDSEFKTELDKYNEGKK